MQKKNVSEILIDVKSRPLMYMGVADFWRANSFINGFHCGLNAGSRAVLDSVEIRNDVLRSRGWCVPSVRIDLEMEKIGLTPEQMVNELFDIEIDVWRVLEKG